MADYAVQVHDNMQNNIPFWEAVYHENIDEAQMAGVAVKGAVSTIAMVVAAPAVAPMVALTGATGGPATAATIATTSLAGGGASVLGDTAGRFVAGKSDVWNPSGETVFWGMATAGVASSYDELIAKPIASRAVEDARQGFSRGFRDNAADQLWDIRVQNGGNLPRTPEVSSLWHQMNYGPPSDQLQSLTSPIAQTIMSSSTGVGISMNSNMWQGAWDIIRD